MRRTYAQVKPRKNTFVTVSGTAWLYPEADINVALSTTTRKHTYDGDSIICPTLSDLIGLYTDIFNQTAITQPIGNTGFSLGPGTLLEDFGRELRFRLTDGSVVIVWRLVKQLTPQGSATVIPVDGNSPNGTIGYTTTFSSFGNAGFSIGLDEAMVVRVG